MRKGFATLSFMNYDIADTIVRFVVLTISLTFHEAAHAWAAMRLGDDTAERMGRLSLNPFVHMDPIGSLMILTMPFGWAKPVPVDPRNLKNPRVGMPLISFAGPFSNLLLGVLGCFIYYLLNQRGLSAGTDSFLKAFVSINFSLAIFNLLPIYPLDGSKMVTLFLSERQAYKYEMLLQRMGIVPMVVVIVLSFLPGAGILGLWFSFWRPLISPILGIFSFPAFF